MNPLALITIGSTSKASPQSRDGGKNPAWKCVGYAITQLIDFPFSPEDVELRVVVFDSRIEDKKEVGIG